MKIITIIAIVILLFFIGVQIYSIKSRSDIEKYTFTLVQKYPEFEIRKYYSSLFTKVSLPLKDYEKASRKGFSILAGYIFGGNEKNQKIAMTSPVRMSLEEKGTTMMFMVPSKLNENNLPKPNQLDIEFSKEPEEIVAVISFGGWANSKKIKFYKNKLIQALDTEGIKYSNKFSFYGYNPPYDLFFRKNEVVVVLK